MQLPLEDKDRAAAQMGVSGSLRESARNTGRQASQKGCLTGGWRGPPVIHKQREAHLQFSYLPSFAGRSNPTPHKPSRRRCWSQQDSQDQEGHACLTSWVRPLRGSQRMVSLQHKHDYPLERQKGHMGPCPCRKRQTRQQPPLEQRQTVGIKSHGRYPKVGPGIGPSCMSQAQINLLGAPCPPAWEKGHSREWGAAQTCNT